MRTSVEITAAAVLGPLEFCLIRGGGNISNDITAATRRHNFAAHLAVIPTELSSGMVQTRTLCRGFEAE